MSPTRRTASGRSTITSTSSFSSRMAIRVSLGDALMMISRRIHLEWWIRRARLGRVHGNGSPERRILERLERGAERSTTLHPQRFTTNEEKPGIEFERRQEAPEEEVRPEISGRLEPGRDADAHTLRLHGQGGHRRAGVHELSLLAMAQLRHHPFGRVEECREVRLELLPHAMQVLAA